MKKVLATIQARMGSTRLPGKVLKDVFGVPMLIRQIHRLQKSRLLDDIVVATSTSKQDDSIVETCRLNNISCFRGSEDDVLSRVTSLLEHYKPEIHVECFGDSPLIDPAIVDEFIGYFLKHYDHLDFVSNSIETSYPPGQEVLVYKSEALIKANSLVRTDDPLREHVSIHISSKEELFKIKSITAPSHYYFPEVYLEVDTQEDFDMIHAVWSYFLKKNNEHFGLGQILDFLKDHPDLTQMNSCVQRRWKQFRSGQ